MDKPPLAVDDTHLSNLTFTGYRIDKIEYEINPNFQFREPLQVNFSLGASISVQDSEQKTAAITLNCNVFENAEQNNYPFTLIISITGGFIFSGDIDEEGFFNFCKTSGTAILFPFLRSAVANITANANMQPLMLPVINVHNFLGDYQKLSEEPAIIQQPSESQ
jgi:preprotein translocase subunit SecB